MSAAILFFAFGSLGLAFQNCTQPRAGEQSSEIEKAAETLPFQYESDLDTIGYMSCYIPKIEQVDKQGFFTIRAGAYDAAGIKLADQYFTDHYKRGPEWMSELLLNSKANSLTQPQLAIRPLSNMQNILTKGQSEYNVEYWNMLAPLGSTEMNKALIDQGLDWQSLELTNRRLKFLRDGLFGVRMEGSLYFMEGKTLETSVRNSFSNNHLLTLTYSAPTENGSSPMAARGPAGLFDDAVKQGMSDARDVYGKGWKLTFSRPTGTTNDRHASVLDSISERNLYKNDKSQLGVWTCPQKLRLKIVKEDNIGDPGANCVKKPDPLVLEGELKWARNILRHEDWWLDLENGCAIPKKGAQGCYGDKIYIDYTFKEPNPSATPATVGCHYGEYNDHKDSPFCAAMVSVCYRKN